MQGKPDHRSLCGRLGPAPSRPYPARSPGLDNSRPGSGQFRSSGSSASHRRCRLGHGRTSLRPRAVVDKIDQLEHASPASNGRGMIDDFRLRGSRMWRRMGDTATTWSWAGRWCTILTTTNLHYQRAQPSLLWCKLCLEIRIGLGLARIHRVLWRKMLRRRRAARPAPRPARRTGGRNGGGSDRFWTLLCPVAASGRIEIRPLTGQAVMLGLREWGRLAGISPCSPWPQSEASLAPPIQQPQCATPGEARA